jgi:type VI secretion system protein ImpK
MISDSPVTLLRATALHVALLSSGASIPAVHLWRARCITLVEELRQAMQDAESPKTDLDEASLAQCVLLDELTLRVLPSASHGEWLREPLQVRFHGVQDGDKRVWERIDSSLRNGRQDRSALELYGIVLDLGFDGGRDNTDAYRLRVRSMLDHGARSDDRKSGHVPVNSATTTVNPCPPSHTSFAPGTSYMRRLACCAIVVAVAVALLWLASDFSPTTAVEHLREQAGALPEERS